MSTRIIQVRAVSDPQKKRGWEVFEADGVCPVWTFAS